MRVPIEWPNRLLTLQDWEAMPPDEPFRLELVEGVLNMVPRPLFMQQRAMLRLGGELDRQLALDLTAVANVEVVLNSGATGGLVTIRVSDLIVVPNETADGNPARFHACDVLLAVEIVSPGTGRTDRVMKMSEYAEVGIPHYWIIELGPPARLNTYRLGAPGQPYVAGVFGAGMVTVTDPAPMIIDLDALTKR